MLGFLQHVFNTHNTDDTILLGASSGALAAVLACCGVEARHAAGVAHKIADKYNIGSRFLGIFGIWGGVVREFLEEILPADAADRVRGKIRIVIKAFPQRVLIASNFQTKQSLIENLMAACHLPFIMDHKPFYWHRGYLCYDGGVWMKEEDLVPLIGEKCRHYYVDYTKDPGHDGKIPCRWVEACYCLALVEDGLRFARHEGVVGWFKEVPANTRMS